MLGHRVTYDASSQQRRCQDCGVVITPEVSLEEQCPGRLSGAKPMLWATRDGTTWQQIGPSVELESMTADGRALVIMRGERPPVLREVIVR